MASHWTTFAATLPSNSVILDLGCGSGAVARALVAARADLEAVGADSAEVPASHHPRISLVSGAPMEHLPFADRVYSGAVSQFGFEYADATAAARELARVLAPGGVVSLLVHHAGSGVVGLSLRRLRALQEMFDDPVRSDFLAGNVGASTKRLAALAQGHPGDRLVCMLVEALSGRVSLHVSDRRRVWQSLENAVGLERQLLQAMMAAAVAPAQMDGWLAPLRRHLDVRHVSELLRGGGEPIAWRVEGVAAGQIL